jgi:hypothetical protein
MQPSIINIHHTENRNIGDRYCRPLDYFPEVCRGWEVRDVAATDRVRIDSLRGQIVILGGGGMLHPWPWEHVVQPLLTGGNRVIAWGIGHHHDAVHGHSGTIERNWRSSLEQYQTDYDLSRFALCGLRDVVDWAVYAPCSTCMHPVFDTPAQATQDCVLYEHGDLDPIAIGGLPRMSNTGPARIETVAEFLASGRTVITNSYHGAYWATLLGRRVVVYEPWCTKFALMRYPLVECTRENWLARLSEAPLLYPEALAECRAATRAFAERVSLVLCEARNQESRWGQRLRTLVSKWRQTR